MSGAGEGAGEGLRWAVEVAGDVCAAGGPVPSQGGAFVCMGTIAYAIAVTPIAMLVGAIRSRPSSEVKAAERSLLSGFNRMDPTGALRDRIVSSGNSGTGFTFLAINRERPDAAQGAPGGVDSIMTLFLDPVLIFDDDNIRPGVTLQIQLTASLVRARDGTVLHTQIWNYRSAGDDFFDLAADDARLLEDVVATAYERLARKIVHDLFVASAPETQEPAGPGNVWAVDTSSFYDVTAASPPDRQGAK